MAKKVWTSEIDAKEQPAPAKRTTRKKYNRARNEDDGVDYEIDDDDDNEEDEESPQPVPTRLTAIFVELGDTLIPWWGVKSVDKVCQFNENCLRVEYGIVINANMTPSETTPRVDVKEFWLSEPARDEAHARLVERLSALGVTFVNARP